MNKELYDSAEEVVLHHLHISMQDTKQSAIDRLASEAGREMYQFTHGDFEGLGAIVDDGVEVIEVDEDSIVRGTFT